MGKFFCLTVSFVINKVSHLSKLGSGIVQLCDLFHPFFIKKLNFRHDVEEQNCTRALQLMTFDQVHESVCSV